MARKIRNVKQHVAASRRDFKSLSDYVRATTNLAGRALQPSNAMTNPGMRLERLVEVYLARRQSRPGPGRNLTWLQKLHIGTLALADDEDYMNFDVVPFVQRGQDLLCEIRAMCKRDVPSMYRQDLFAGDNELGDFLGAMFAMPWENNKTWGKACDMLSEFIEEFGDMELTRAQGQLHSNCFQTEEAVDATHFSSSIEEGVENLRVECGDNNI
jgi:hypothetical protein